MRGFSCRSFSCGDRSREGDACVGRCGAHFSGLHSRHPQTIWVGVLARSLSSPRFTKAPHNPEPLPIDGDAAGTERFLGFNNAASGARAQRFLRRALAVEYGKKMSQVGQSRCEMRSPAGAKPTACAMLTVVKI